MVLSNRWTKTMSSRNQRHLVGRKKEKHRRQKRDMTEASLSEGFCVLSPQLKVLQLFGHMESWYSGKDGRHQPRCYQIFHHPPRQKACPRCPIMKTFRDSQVHRATLKFRRDNHDMRVLVTAMPIKDANGKVIAAIEKMQNGTRRLLSGAESEGLVSIHGTMAPKLTGFSHKALERELREETRRLRALLETTNALTSSLDREIILKIIGDKTKELLEADGCTIYLLDATGKRLKPIFSNEAHVAAEVLAFEMKIGEGLSGKVAESGVARIVNHAEEDEDICVQIPGTPLEPECLISAPLITKEKVVGVMTLNREGEREFHQRDLELLTIFANQVAGIVENARLYNRLKESEERYRGIFENSRDTLYITDSKGKILEINPACRKMLGLEKRKIVGQRLDSLFVDSSQRAKLYQQIRRVGFVKNVEAQIKSADGKILDVLETSTTLRGSAGTVIGFTGIIRDITERKKLQEELIQSQKLEAIGRLAGGVAHDFNNLLSGILGYSSYAKSLVSRKSKMWRTLDMIQKSSERAADLTRQLLGFSRRAKYQTETAQVNELITEVLKLIERALNKNVIVQKMLDPHLPPVDVDVTQIQQTILNLCLNANDAMRSKGGRLTLETKIITLEEKDTLLRYLNLSPGRYIEIAISDSGVGMDSAIRSRVFEPFFTTKAEGKGTGLGLALAYGIVKSHGGDITCYSALGHGSTFKIYLPIAKGALSTRARKKKAKDRDLPRGHETILIVDDEEVVRHLAKDVLTSLGYQVIVAANGEEAIRLYEARCGDIALILLDIIVPQMGGDKIYTDIKRVNSKVKILFSSGHSRDQMTDQFIKEQGDHFIQKPYTMVSLAQVVRKTLDA